MFTSGPNTWHGMEKKKIIKERRCIQVNYVTFETDWKVEQSYFSQSNLGKESKTLKIPSDHSLQTFE